MKFAGPKVAMTFYESSDGPRILLFGPIDVNLAPLQRSFRELGRKGGAIRLEEQSYVVSDGEVELLMKAPDAVAAFGRNGIRRGLIRVSNLPLSFEWTCLAEQWELLADLIDPVVNSKQACHQYLDAGFADRSDAMIEVSKGEYSGSFAGA